MDGTTTNSSGNVNWCLICSCTYPKVNVSSNDLNSPISFTSTNYERNWLVKATEKIFECLLISKEHLVNVKKKECLLSYCLNCMEIVEEIMKLHKKAEILKLQIQWKAETLGRIAIDTPAPVGVPEFTENEERDQKEVAEVWNTFKNQITRNFRQGLLPNPSVIMGNDFPSTFRKSENNSNNSDTESEDEVSSSDDESSHCNGSNVDVDDTGSDSDVVYVEPEEKIIPEIKIESDDDDSNEDQFQTVPSDSVDPDYNNDSSPSPSKRRKYNKPRGHKSVKNSVERIRRRKRRTAVVSTRDLDEENPDWFKCTKCDYRPRRIGNRYNAMVRSYIANHYSNFHNPVEPIITADGKYCYKCTNCDFSYYIYHSQFQAARLTCKRKLSLHYMEMHDAKSQLNSNNFDIIPMRFADIENYRDTGEKKKEIEKLTEGRDYIKCTKCDYIAKRTPASKRTPYMLRKRIAEHYSSRHNPVKLTDVSKVTTYGEDCYNCTKCTLSIVIQRGNRYHFHQRLSLHYMEVHDVSEGQISAEPVVDGLNVENVSNEGQVTQLNGEVVKDSVTFQSSDVTKITLNDVAYEEVTVKNEIWSGDYEEVEEMGPGTIIESQEIISPEQNNSDLISSVSNDFNHFQEIFGNETEKIEYKIDIDTLEEVDQID